MAMPEQNCDRQACQGQNRNPAEPDQDGCPETPTRGFDGQTSDERDGEEGRQEKSELPQELKIPTTTPR
jgi:hypothetical protein